MIKKIEIEFSITFWIKKNENPGWNINDSIIRFPLFIVKNGIKVSFIKNQRNLKVFILHPEIGYRKMIADIKNNIGSDTFIALNVKNEVTELYINAKLVSSKNTSEILASIEVGDMVMAKVINSELKSINIGEGIEKYFPAEIKSIEGEKCTMLFFEFGEIIELSMERIII